MPKLKATAGHTTLSPLFCYLETGSMAARGAEGRALAHDFVNVLTHDARGRTWAEQMDRTRGLFGNDRPVGGKHARTFVHYVLSPDPRDGVTLAEMREYARDWVAASFEGRFQVATVYHAADESGSVHAHVVVNNTDLTNGHRLSGWMTNGRLHRIRYEAERLAEERGWRNVAYKLRGFQGICRQ